MTEKLTKYGCLSKSLDKFLSMKDDNARKKEYGSITTAKYYERIVKEVNGSFKDHRKILTKLPKEHRKKIDFMTEYNQIIQQAVITKWLHETPDKILKETIQHMEFMRQDVRRKKDLDLVAGKDFDKVLHWLQYLQNLQSKK